MKPLAISAICTVIAAVFMVLGQHGLWVATALIMATIYAAASMVINALKDSARKGSDQ